MLARDCDAVGRGAVLGASLSCDGRRQEEGGTGVWPRASDADRCGRLLLPRAGEDYMSTKCHMCEKETHADDGTIIPVSLTFRLCLFH